MLPTLPIILASSSPARKMLLQRLQLPFRCISPNIDESPLPGETPAALAIRLAHQKAEAIAEQITEHALIIGSDQVIMHGTIRLDKPLTFENATAQLALVSGKAIDSWTGLCVLNTHTGHYQTGVETCRVVFRELTPKIIAHYLQQDNPLQCAGSIKAESLGITLLKTIEGSDPSALTGLPLILLTDMLIKENYIFTY